MPRNGRIIDTKKFPSDHGPVDPYDTDEEMVLASCVLFVLLFVMLVVGLVMTVMIVRGSWTTVLIPTAVCLIGLPMGFGVYSVVTFMKGASDVR